MYVQMLVSVFTCSEKPGKRCLAFLVTLLHRVPFEPGFLHESRATFGPSGRLVASNLQQASSSPLHSMLELQVGSGACQGCYMGSGT